jgi:hypothetical protein
MSDGDIYEWNSQAPTLDDSSFEEVSSDEVDSQASTDVGNEQCGKFNNTQ